ncbi:Ankyrin repeat-containing domain protein [Moelleriella libera RCEF 2490]|uniref:Ankyrin repeat-containing domain protein n=1 Tax=Moelleriella libera RCEF 2490 TaxID=1081109 RepID=A0A167XN26_9HYPO|nr:Ankyrin repeat-containing domain protein [Moelleriella libera RCEF 2490]
MRLLARSASGGFQLTDDLRDEQVPRYAILSHTWGSEEVSFQDLTNHTGENKRGYDKIRFCADQAAIDKISYFWVHTCCIDKRSHTELSEAIISMFRWYQNATKCYVYLADVSIRNNLEAANKPAWEVSFHNSRWFTRGWTLQELLAPAAVEFFSREGIPFGDKNSLKDEIYHITKIPLAALQGTALSRFGFRDRLAWAINRRTTREEDEAYSLLGIFEVQMTPRYGEGKKRAFDRLRGRIKKARASFKARREPRGDSENSRPSKRRSRGSMDGAETSATQASGRNGDHIDKDIKQSLIEQLYFPQIDERLTSLSPAQANTCRWFLAKMEYTAWRNVSQQPDNGGFLWIKGNPGTGKSTLMKLLFEEAKFESQGDTSQITLSFFFLARGTMEEKSTTGLYRSLLHQLFRMAPDLRNSLDWMTGDGARGIAQNGWHEQAMRQTLMRVILMLGHRMLTIFVDALDECDRNQTAGMVSFFEELCEQASQNKVQLRICFSSRHYPTIVITKGIEITLEDEDGHREDIRLYIRSKLRLSRTREAESLRLEILEKSSGIFLWVVLVLDILNTEYPNNSVSIANIRNRLGEIPPGLKDLFEMILRRDGENIQRLQICLQWVLFAARSLAPQELYVAVQLGLDKEHPSLWDEDDVDPDAMKTFMRTCSKGLAEVTRSKISVVQFIHESVRDFLLDRYREPWSGASGNVEGHCHDMLRICCLAQLTDSIEQKVSIPDHTPQTREAQDIKNNILSKFPFFEYSVLHILHHADLAQQHGVNQADFLANFPLARWVLLNNVLERHYIRRYTKSVSLLYLLAEKNLANLIRIHPRARFYLDVENERYGTPLFAALATDSRKAIESFADMQSDLQLQRPLSPDIYMKFSQSMKRCPRLSRDFICARTKTHFDYIQTRKDEGFFAFYVNAGLMKANTYCWWNRDGLSCAAERGYENSVPILLNSKSMIIDSKDGLGRTPLFLAAQQGHENIMQQLLKNGADVELKDRLGWTPLSVAASQGHGTIVDRLLEIGVDTEMKDSWGRTPFLLAAAYGRQTVVLRMLKVGTNAESKNELGQTPLLQRGRILVDAQDNNGRTALALAAKNGHIAVAQLLIDGGAEVESRSAMGCTTLSYAALGGHEDVARLLLDSGRAKVNAKDDAGRTPLAWAARGGHVAVARLLLARDAEVDSKDARGYTPLFEVEETIKLLLEKGAGVMSKNIFGETPWSHAVKNDYQNVLRLLRARGSVELDLSDKESQDATITNNSEEV